MTQWLGGMGIIVLALAVLPRLSGGGRALMERESPGPDFDKLVPRIRDTAARLWGLYVGISAIGIAAFWLSGAFGLEPRMGLYSADLPHVRGDGDRRLLPRAAVVRGVRARRRSGSRSP